MGDNDRGNDVDLKASAVGVDAARFAAGPSSATFAADGAGTDGKPKPRKFRMVANTGAPMPHWLFGRAIVDLDTLQIPETSIPVLVSHDHGRIAGWTAKIERTAEGLVAEGTLSGATDDGRQVAALSDEGFPWQASIFVPPQRLEDVPAGETVKVNGRDFAGPGVIFRNAKLGEVSFCALGADDATSARALAASAVNNASRNQGPRAPEGQMKNDTPPAAPDLVVQERERVAGIMAEAKALGLPDAAFDLVKDGASLADARVSLRDRKLATLKAAAPAPTGQPAPGAPAPTGTTFENLPIPERAKMEFAADPLVRDEFGRVEFYEAFLRASAGNRVKMHSSAAAFAARR